MRAHLTIYFVFIMGFCSLCYSAETPPEWFGKLSEKSLLIGYGEADTRDAALSMARKDIAESLQTAINSQSTLAIQKNDGDVQQSYASKSVATSSINLGDTEIIKEQQVKGRWFMAVSYDNAPLAQRFVRKIKNVCAISNPHPYIQLTPLYEDIKTQAQCSPMFDLIRLNNQWAISANGNNVAMRSDDDFSRLWFAPFQNENLHLEINPRQINNAEKFFLTITSKINGYVALYNVYGNGSVLELSTNIPVAANQPVKFPDAHFKNQELIGVLENPKKSAQEMYVAIFSPQPIMSKSFVLTSSRMESGESVAMIDALLKELGNKSFASAILRIRAR